MADSTTDVGERHQAAPENKDKAERLAVKKDEVRKSVRNNQDSEANVLVDAFKSGISSEGGLNSSSPIIRETASLHQEARKSADNITEPGEADKLLADLRALYKITGGNYDIDSLPEDKKDLVQRVDVWKKERPLGSLDERNARGLVQKALVNDIVRGEANAQVAGGDITSSLSVTFQKLEAKIGDEGKLAITRKDSVTGQEYITEIRKDGDTWIAEERKVGENGEIISQAKIGASGSTELTLNYTGRRYQRRANPEIKASSEYQGTTATVFSLLSESVLEEQTADHLRWTKDVINPDKLKRDLDGFGERAGQEYFLKGYIVRKAEAELAKEELLKEAGSKNISRAGTRREAYKLQRADKKLKEMEMTLLDIVGQDDKKEDLLKAGQKPEVEFAEATPIDQMTNDQDRKDLIDSRKIEFKDELEQKGGKFAETFGSLDETNQDAQIVALLNIERRIAAGKDNLAEAIKTGDPEIICKFAGEIKHAELEKDAMKAEIDVALAEKRREKSVDSWKTSWKNLVRQVSHGRFPVGSVISATKEVIASHGRLITEKVQQKLNPLIERIKEGTQDIGEDIVEIMNYVDEGLTEAYQVTAGVAIGGVRETVENFHAKMAAGEAKFERTKIEVRKKYYETRHAVDITKQEALMKVGVEVLAAKKHALIGIAKAMPGQEEEQKKKYRERHERLKEAKERLLQWKTKEIQDKMADNPRFAFFAEQIEEHAAQITAEAPPPTTARQEESPAPQPSAAEAEAVKQPEPEIRPEEQGESGKGTGRYEEYVSGTGTSLDNQGQIIRRYLRWDEKSKTVVIEDVDEHGKPTGPRVEMFAATHDIAKVLINSDIKDRLEREGYEVNRNFVPKKPEKSE